jgi:phage I-like protein
MNKKEFKQSKTNDQYRGIFPFEFDEKGGDAPAIPEKIHLIPIGQWEHDLYGPIIINNSDIREFIQNFNAGVRKGVFITAGHEGFQELPAVGWIKEVESRDDGLWGTVDWNSTGEKSLSEKEFKFFSPELCRDYEDPQTHQYYRNVLTGGALTKSPYFKELQGIVFSDKNIKSLNKKIIMTKTLAEVLELEADKLTAEDKEVLEANKGELTAEQAAKYGITVEAPAETPEEKEAGDANEAAGLNRDGSAKTTEQEHSEKSFVKISASELKILRDKADQGVEAYAELEKKNIDAITSGMVFSASNKLGKFLPKSKDNLRAFIEKLNKDQRAAFSALVGQLEVSQKFAEVGAGSKAVEGTAVGEVEAKITAKMEKNKDMKYSEALKEVMSENVGLEQRYDEELPSARKGN